MVKLAEHEINTEFEFRLNDRNLLVEIFKLEAEEIDASDPVNHFVARVKDMDTGEILNRGEMIKQVTFDAAMDDGWNWVRAYNKSK